MTETPIICIDPAKYAMRLTTTVTMLRDKVACVERFAHLLNKLKLAEITDTEDSRELISAISALSEEQMNRPINLLTILDLNGTEDCIWALCATEQNCDVPARLMAADFAESCLHEFESRIPRDLRPRQAINAARAFAIGELESAASSAASIAASSATDSTARSAASSAAISAAWSAADIAACSAANSAAINAADSAAYSVDNSANWNATSSANWIAACSTVRSSQADIFRRYLLP